MFWGLFMVLLIHACNLAVSKCSNRKFPSKNNRDCTYEIFVIDMTNNNDINLVGIRICKPKNVTLYLNFSSSHYIIMFYILFLIYKGDIYLYINLQFKSHSCSVSSVNQHVLTKQRYLVQECIQFS